MTAHSSRLPFSLDPLLAEAKRRMRKRRALVIIVAAALVGAGAASATTVFASSSSGSSAPPVNCGRAVLGSDFHVFACMSGGARTGHPHPEELLVVREDGAPVAYPAFRVGKFAVGDRKVVATYDTKLVRVTSSRLVPLVTTNDLAQALRIRPAAIADLYATKVATHGDLYFVASIVSRAGCQTRTLERTAGGTIHQIRASSTSRNNSCG